MSSAGNSSDEVLAVGVLINMVSCALEVGLSSAISVFSPLKHAGLLQRLGVLLYYSVLSPAHRPGAQLYSDLAEQIVHL